MMLAEFNLLGGPMGVALLLAVVGCALVVLEVLLPSGGIIGFFAAAALVGSVGYAFYAGGPTTGLSMSLGLLVAVPALVALAFKVLPMTPWGKALLGEPPNPEDVAPEDTRHELVGRVGVARSKMLPSGSVEIDGAMIDAVSQSQAIDPGEYVKVVEVRGNRVVVRRAPTGERPGHENPDDLLTRPIEDLGIDSLDDPLA